MFDKVAVADRIRGYYSPEIADFVLTHIPEDEMRVLDEDRGFLDVQHYHAVAQVNASPQSEFEHLGALVAKPGWYDDYQQFTCHWIGVAQRFESFNLGRSLQREPTNKEIQDSLVRAILRVGSRSISQKCRAVYATIYPGRMEVYSPPEPTTAELHVCAA
jgi:hypothetical protein